MVQRSERVVAEVEVLQAAQLADLVGQGADPVGLEVEVREVGEAAAQGDVEPSEKVAAINNIMNKRL